MGDVLVVAGLGVPDRQQRQVAAAVGGVQRRRLHLQPSRRSLLLHMTLPGDGSGKYVALEIYSDIL